MSYKVKPKKDRLIIVAEKQKDVTDGGIIIPEKSNKNLTYFLK